MARSSLLILCFILSIQFSWSQDGRYVIFFSDKSGSTYSVNNPLEFLSQKSINRRLKNNVTTTSQDFPVNQAYVNQLKSLGANVLHTSRWMNCALVQVSNSELSDISALPFVMASEFIGPVKVLPGGRSKKLKQKNDTKQGEANIAQNSMIGLDDMHNDNILGQGITIAVFDSGFQGVNLADPFSSLFSEGRVLFTYDLVGKSNNVYQYDDHGTEVLSVMAADKIGAYRGGVPKANYHLYVTEDVGSEYRIEEYNWLIAAEKADSAGVDIINSSLGYNLFDDASMNYTTSQLDGNTAVVSKAATLAISKGLVVVVSAGNDGNTPWKFVNPPGDVDGIFAVGSITGSGSLSNFSSRGPTSDGRIKPDVVALGSGVSVIKSSGNTGSTSGTSLSAPLITSLAAGLMQTFPELTVNELYQLIIASASLYTSPNNQMGYGIPHYGKAKTILNEEEPTPPSSTIIIYPNPIEDGLIRIELDVNPGEIATVFIYSLQGSLVMKSEEVVSFFNNPIEINLNELAAGLYILKVEVNGLLKTTRLVKH